MTTARDVRPTLPAIGLAMLATVGLPSVASPQTAAPGIRPYPQMLKMCMDWQGHPANVWSGCSAVIREKRETADIMAMAYNNRGIMHERMKEPAKALADYDAAIALNPDYANAYNNRGILHGDRGDFPRALADFDRALELKPGFVEALRGRAKVYHDAGQSERALAEYDGLLATSSNKMFALFDRGWQLMRMGRAERAAADFSRILEVQPDNRDVLVARAGAWRMKGDARRALTDYDRVLRRSTAANARAGRAWALAVLGRQDEAMRVTDSIIAERPHPEAHASHGFIELMRGRFDVALADFDAALKLHQRHFEHRNESEMPEGAEMAPTLPAALFGRGLARLKLGDRGGTADIEAARKILPVIDVQFAVAGLKP